MNKIKVSEKNEGTRSPYWIIIDPSQNFWVNNDGVHNIASMITGIWFSRESAEEFLHNTRYNFSKHAVVYCMSGTHSHEYESAVENEK